MKKILLGLLVFAFGTVVSAAPFYVESFPGKVKVLVEMIQTGSEVDVLYVIDDSGSMNSHQSNLAKHLDIMTNQLKSLSSDFQLGVITTDTQKGGTLIGSPSFLKQDHPDLENVIRARVKVGNNGSYYEMPFDTINLSLNNPANIGFYRPHALLYTLILTDAEDQSQISVSDLAKNLTDLKGDAGRVQIDGILVSDPKKCPADDKPPLKIIDLISFFKGTHSDLCDVSFSGQIKKIANSLKDFVDKHNKGTVIKPAATLIPLPSKPLWSSVVVKYGTQVIPQGFFDTGWVYSNVRNEIQLGSDIEWTLQPDGTELEVTYTPFDWQ